MKLKFEIQLDQLGVVENDPKLPAALRKMIELIRKKQLQMEQQKETMTDEAEQTILGKINDLDTQICEEIDEWRNFEDEEEESVVTNNATTATTPLPTAQQPASTVTATNTERRRGRPRKEETDEEKETREAEELQKKLDAEKAERLKAKNNPETRVRSIMEKYEGRIHFNDLREILGGSPGFSATVGKLQLHNIPMTNYYSENGK